VNQTRNFSAHHIKHAQIGVCRRVEIESDRGRLGKWSAGSKLRLRQRESTSGFVLKQYSWLETRSISSG
ncbi:MAG TPA: hypothetical protein VIL33_02715, partial [Rhodothermia bacterium]